MAYSLDLRKRVVGFVEEGGSKAEAARRFQVREWCVQDWWRRPDLAPKRHGPRRRKLARLALRHHVAQSPESTLKERAQHLGVQMNAIWFALNRLKITHKKNSAVR